MSPITYIYIIYVYIISTPYIYLYSRVESTKLQSLLTKNATLLKLLIITMNNSIPLLFQPSIFVFVLRIPHNRILSYP